MSGSSAPYPHFLVRPTASDWDLFVDLLRDGIILLDDTGRVLQCNRTARELLDAEDALALYREHLVALDRGATARLNDRVATVLAGREVGVLHEANLRIWRQGGRRLYLRICPVGPGWTDVGPAKAAVLVVICDPECAIPPSEELLQEFFYLTPAEARLVRLLVQGQTLKQAARSLGVTWSTTRVQLKQVFVKVGVRRQPDLIRIVLSILGPGLRTP